MAPHETTNSSTHSSLVSEEAAYHERDDEAAVLRDEVRRLQMLVEVVEEERDIHAGTAKELQNYNASMVEELHQMHRKSKNADFLEDDNFKKRLKIAELSISLEKLRAGTQSLKEENEMLKKKGKEDHSKMQVLSKAVRSLQFSFQYSEEVDESETDSDDEENEVITAEKALDLTLKRMKYQIEVLEEEREEISAKCKEQGKKIERLQKESELKDAKVEVWKMLFQTTIQENNTSSLPRHASVPNLCPNQNNYDSKAREAPSRGTRTIVRSQGNGCQIKHSSSLGSIREEKLILKE